MSNDGGPQSDASPSPSPSRFELTVTALIVGVGLSVVMSMATVYLGLRAGMTVSASIPAAVVAIGFLRALGRSSILEANLVQTAASAGESLAAGIIFTVPAFVLTGIWTDFDYWTTSFIALAGGLLGVLFMIPMRRVFIVDNAELKYPEGVACAEVLKAGSGESAKEDGAGGGVAFLLGGMLFGAGYKIMQSLMTWISGAFEKAALAGNRVVYFGGDASPALMCVGYIVGLGVAIQIFLGGAIGWLVALPMFDATAYAAAPDQPALEIAKTIGKTQIRYIGVGAMVVGGLVSIWKVRAGMVGAIREVRQMAFGAAVESPAEERNLSGSAIVGLTATCLALIVGVYYVVLQKNIPLTLLTTACMVTMAFFFTAVASYIVGLVGNSNSPVSGMTISAVLGTGLLIGLLGFEGQAAMAATLGVAGVVCCVACTSGDVCNDLKTGQLVGASPRQQQIMQVLGVAFAAFVMAPTLSVLHKVYGIGSDELPAPQAGLFKSIAEGFFGDEKIPLELVGVGAGIAAAMILANLAFSAVGTKFRLHLMPVAVGIYLPLTVSTPILIGGLIRWAVNRSSASSEAQDSGPGVLIGSGVIAGESLVGVLVGFYLFARTSQYDWLRNSLPDFEETFGGMLSDGGKELLGVVLLTCLAVWLYVASTRNRSGDKS